MRRNTNKNLNGYLSNERIGITRFNYSGIITNNQNYIIGLENNTWEPPSDWLELPRLQRGDQRFAGLMAIIRGASGNTGACADSNFVALRCAGNYIVDWGNGVTTAHASNTTAQYQYNFENIPNSTLTSEGYKQVIIQAYPQSGQNLTTVNLQQIYSVPGVTLNSGYVSGWLDIKIVGANISTLVVNQLSTVIQHSMLKRFEFVGPSSLTALDYVLWNLVSVEKILGQEFTANCTQTLRLVSGCNSLTYLDLLDTRKVAGNPSAPFEGASSLKTIPPIDTSNWTSISFRLCRSLRNVPTLNTSQMTSLSFEFCTALKTIPLLDTSKVTNWENAFNGCSSLEELPPLNTSSGTNFLFFLSNCSNLKKIPQFNYSNATSLRGAFLRGRFNEISFIDAPKTTNFNSAFAECRTLSKVYGITFGPLSDSQGAQSMFADCPNLVEIGPLSFGSMTAGSTLSTAGPLLNAFHTGLFGNTPGPLGSIRIYGLQKSINLANKVLSAANLNDIFTNLVDVTGTGATITITNNWGLAGCSTGIATSKGWTVVS